MFLAPFFDALSAGPAFDDPLFPDGSLLGVLNVVDCHGSVSCSADLQGLAQIRTNLCYH